MTTLLFQRGHDPVVTDYFAFVLQWGAARRSGGRALVDGLGRAHEVFVVAGLQAFGALGATGGLD